MKKTILLLLCCCGTLILYSQPSDSARRQPLAIASNDTTHLTADIKALIAAATSYLKKNTESKSGWETFTDRTDKVIAILSALVALIVSIMAFFKKGFMTKYKAIIAAVAVLSFAALMAFLLAGFLQTVIFAALVIALIIFLFLLLALKCIEFLDKKGYAVVDGLLASFN